MPRVPGQRRQGGPPDIGVEGKAFNSGNRCDIVTMQATRQQRASASYALHDRIMVDSGISRKVVSYQGNKTVPGFRWMRYKEGFSTELVSRLLSMTDAKTVLDPFSGIGTTPLVASSLGMKSVGIDIMPVGNMTANAIIAAANDIRPERLTDAFDRLYNRLDGITSAEFGHVRITRRAFPPETEMALVQARKFINRIRDAKLRLVMDVMCMSVLEDVSYTRKDGQFLRWDPGSGRRVSKKLDKGKLPTLAAALSGRLADVLADMPHLRETYGGAQPRLITGSCLTALRDLPADSFDAVVTSPPYANRYDYTRTYALELAWLGYDQGAFNALRQTMLSATVENKPKAGMLETVYGDSQTLTDANDMATDNAALRNVLASLRRSRETMNNPQVIRLVENYFGEMALVIRELGRVVRPGGNVFMVNDNVRYNGVEVPVDIILSGFAESSGFRCESIRTLARGKGNSSQQMGRFGRQELRKGIYHWRRL